MTTAEATAPGEPPVAKRYRVEVCNHRERAYIIEAESQEEAIRLALVGRHEKLYPTNTDEVCHQVAEEIGPEEHERSSGKPSYVAPL